MENMTVFRNQKSMTEYQMAALVKGLRERVIHLVEWLDLDESTG